MEKHNKQVKALFIVLILCIITIKNGGIIVVQSILTFTICYVLLICYDLHNFILHPRFSKI